jgi:hypothetical protein
MSVLEGVTERSGKNEIAFQPLFYAVAAFLAIRFDPSRQVTPYFALRWHRFRPIRRVMGQQHRVRAKRQRRIAYLDRKKMAAKAAPVRREAPKVKAKSKKQVAAVTPEA